VGEVIRGRTKGREIEVDVLENGALIDTITGDIVDPLIIRLDEPEAFIMRHFIESLDQENARGYQYELLEDRSFVRKNVPRRKGKQ
jgi:hypothetical protein